MQPLGMGLCAWLQKSQDKDATQPGPVQQWGQWGECGRGEWESNAYMHTKDK